jgi:hypothetical protein
MFRAGVLIAITLIATVSPIRAADNSNGITAIDAQRLPLRELAHRVLGQVGDALVADVDRPSWGDPTLPAPVPSPMGAPPLYELTFYSRPYLVIAYGLCGEDVITVRFRTADGSDSSSATDTTPMKPEMISAEVRYGVVGSVEPPADYWTDAYEKKLREICASQEVARNYFPAHNNLEAQSISRLVQALAAAGEHRKPFTFRLKCVGLGQPCPDAHKSLASLDVRNIESVKTIDCPSPSQLPKYPQCYKAEILRPGSRNSGAYARWEIKITSSFYHRDMTIHSVDMEFFVSVY